MQFLITFDSTHHALRAESLLEQANCSPDIIPTPRDLTASCGLSILLKPSSIDASVGLLTRAQVIFKAVYQIETDSLNGKKLYTEIKEVN